MKVRKRRQNSIEILRFGEEYIALCEFDVEFLTVGIYSNFQQFTSDQIDKAYKANCTFKCTLNAIKTYIKCCYLQCND